MLLIWKTVPQLFTQDKEFVFRENMSWTTDIKTKRNKFYLFWVLLGLNKLSSWLALYSLRTWLVFRSPAAVFELGFDFFASLKLFSSNCETWLTSSRICLEDLGFFTFSFCDLTGFLAWVFVFCFSFLYSSISFWNCAISASVLSSLAASLLFSLAGFDTPSFAFWYFLFFF